MAKTKFPSQLDIQPWNLTLYHTISLSMTLSNIDLENMGKGENLLIPLMISVLQSYLICHLQTHSIWNSIKFCHLVKSVTFYYKIPGFYDSEE